MTTVRYLWRGGGEERLLKTYPEAQALVAEKGGSYETVYKEQLSQEEAYCMAGAFSATDRWKNYKY